MNRERNWMVLSVWLTAVWLAPAVAAGTLAQFRTVFGDIQVELFERDKPVTVGNFIRYVNSGRWDAGFAHRCVPGFVVQGGGFRVTGLGTSSPQFEVVPDFGMITNEFAVGPRLSNTYGTVAMAKLGGATNSASSQWFFNLADNPGLDAAHPDYLFVVFGRAVGGTNVLNVFNTFRSNGATNVIKDYRSLLGPAFGELPLLSTNATFADLIYFDVTLLEVGVTNGGSGPVISWNSVAGRTNRVEFTRQMPPLWETLVRTNGTGVRMATTDPSPGEGFRFYRVRVEY